MSTYFRPFYYYLLMDIDNLHPKVMFGNGFCFLFSKTCFWEYKEKTIFLYFLNQKYVWLVEIKKIIF